MNWLAEMEARRLVLSLREMLVRFDENLAAHTLLQECVPYVCEGDPEIDRAREEQRLKVQHIIDPEKYAPYYRSNIHEKPFEDQYQMAPEEAHEYLHRVAFLREWLEGQETPPRLLDVACNDGWMAQNLEGLFESYLGLDLNPDCIRRAVGRKTPETHWLTAYAEKAAEATRGRCGTYDVVVAYELVEHVRDPDALLHAMASVCKPGGSLFVSTPLGACTGGALDRWWVVEPAGHVRAFTVRSFHELLSRHGECEQIAVSKASVGELMVARVTRPLKIVAPDAR